MDSEKAFFRALKSLTLHLIKNVDPLYRDLVPIVQALEGDAWADCPSDRKLVVLDKLKEKFRDGTAFREHFDAYPHSSAKKKLKALEVALDGYYEAIQGRP